jgi:phosphohistidine phosphatase SixA
VLIGCYEIERDMFNRKVIKPVLGLSLVFLIFCFYEYRGGVEDIDLKAENTRKTKELLDGWKKGEVIVFIRHEERCDRSDSPCLESSEGITSMGSKRAEETGEKLRTYLGLDNVDIITSPTVRTVQTVRYMLGIVWQLPAKDSICGDDVVEEMLGYKKSSRNLILVTHSSCIEDLAGHMGFRGFSSPGYGDLLFLRVKSSENIKVIGRSGPG